MKKKLIRITLCVMAIMCISAITAFAAGGGDYTYENGVLTINTNDGLTSWSNTVTATDVTSIVIGTGVTQTLNSNPFTACTNATTLKFEGTSTLGGTFSVGSSIKSIVFEGATTIKDLAFSGSDASSPNETLEKITFAAGSTIQNSAFSNYTGLESVTFEGDIILGGDQSPFSGCTSLKSLTFEGTSTLSGSTFSVSGASLENISFGGETTISSGEVFSCGSGKTNTTLTKLVLPAGSSLPKYAFDNYTGLKTVTFEGGVSLADDIFRGCTDLKDFYFNLDSENLSSYIKPSRSTFSAFTSTSENAINIHVPSEAAVEAYKALLKEAGLTSANYDVHAEHTWVEGYCSKCNIACDHAGETKQWAYNETQHWKEYPCGGAKSDLGNHDWSNGNTCECGYVKVVHWGSSVQRPTIITPEHGTITLSYNGRTATITPDAGYEIKSVILNNIEQGAVTELTGLKTGDTISATFGKTKETLDSEARAAVASLSTMKARSSKTAKKNVKVRLLLSDSDNAQLASLTDLGYTVKYKFYRSTKKASAYKAMKTKSSTTYINTKGVKKKMYYYKARVLVYDQDGKLVAATAIKDCKYANRTWTKK